MSGPYSTDTGVMNKMSIYLAGFGDVGFPSCGTRSPTCFRSWTCAVGAGDVWSVWLISTSHSLCLSSHSVSFCLSSLFLSCPSSSIISHALISPRLIPAFMLLTPSTLFPHTFRVVSAISHSLFPSALLSTLSASWWVWMNASSASCSQHLQPTPILIIIIHACTHSLLLHPRKGQLLKMWAGRDFSVFLTACLCVSVSVCVCIHLLEPGMLAHKNICNKKSMDDVEFHPLGQITAFLKAWEVLNLISFESTYPQLYSPIKSWVSLGCSTCTLVHTYKYACKCPYTHGTLYNTLKVHRYSLQEFVALITCPDTHRHTRTHRYTNKDRPSGWV